MWGLSRCGMKSEKVNNPVSKWGVFLVKSEEGKVISPSHCCWGEKKKKKKNQQPLPNPKQPSFSPAALRLSPHIHSVNNPTPYTSATRHTALHLARNTHVPGLSSNQITAFSSTSNRMQCLILQRVSYIQHSQQAWRYQPLPYKLVTSFFVVLLRVVYNSTVLFTISNRLERNTITSFNVNSQCFYCLTKCWSALLFQIKIRS